ncbi:MAG: ATP-binding protein [Dehalococcoidales bacterium]
MTNKFEIELESKIENLPVISKFVNRTLTGFQADPDTVNKAQMAIDEACTNIINYAYSGAVGPLKVALDLVGEDIIIIIKDRGKPFDPTTIPPPDLTADVNERKEGGLGFYLIQKLMDCVSYSYDPLEGNQLILKKTRRKS